MQNAVGLTEILACKGNRHIFRHASEETSQLKDLTRHPFIDSLLELQLHHIALQIGHAELMEVQLGFKIELSLVEAFKSVDFCSKLVSLVQVDLRGQKLGFGLRLHGNI